MNNHERDETMSEQSTKTGATEADTQTTEAAADTPLQAAKLRYTTCSKRIKASLAEGDWCCQDHRMLCDVLLTQCSGVKKELHAKFKAEKLTEAEFIMQLSEITTKAEHVFALIELHQAHKLINMRVTVADLQPV